MKKLPVLIVAMLSVATLLLASCAASETTLTSVDNANSDSADSDTVPDASSSTNETATATPEVVDSAIEAAIEAADEVTKRAEEADPPEPRRADDEFTDAELQCLEEAGIDAFDLIEAGRNATSGDVSGDDEQIYNEVFRCAPDWALSDAFVSEFAAGMGEGVSGDISNAEGRCVVQNLIDTGNGGSVLFGGDAVVIVDIFEGCLSPENAAEMFGAPGTGPQTYGDNEAFDLLQDRCVGTGDLNDIACDVLYFNSSVESDYEAIALTCGDRESFSDISCTDDMFDDNGDRFIDPDSPGVAGVEDACRAGAMIACDYLYSLTEFGSSTEQLGGTCGDRGSFDGLTLCVERFGEKVG